MLEPRILLVRSFALALGASVLFFLGFGAMLLSGVLFLTGVWHESVLHAGLMLFPGPATATVFSVPSAPGRPLNFCQSPVISKIFLTGSVGCAPTDSQCWARSELTSMNDGSAFGWYLPISSIARPSRLVRASATTIL